jgi:hypothetical protein
MLPSLKKQVACPNCGAPVSFAWSSSVQSTCEYCKSIIVRTDVDVRKVGEVSDLPADASPIQLNAEGQYRGKSFVVVGRIVYEYELGTWNEWHCISNTGDSLWLGDAQANYTITSKMTSPAHLPKADDVKVGDVYQWAGPLTVSVITLAKYRGVQGELPFEFWDKDVCIFADLRGSDNKFATIDYTEEPPLFYLGESVEFNDLKLKGLREFEGW